MHRDPRRSSLERMQTTLAIYEALIQANVPAATARHVADTLEQDMTTALATKQDLQHLELGLRQEIRHLGEVTEQRISGLQKDFDALGKHVDQRIGSLEQRMDQSIGSLEERMNQSIRSLEQRMDQRIGSAEQRMDQRTDSLEQRMHSLEQLTNVKFQAVAERFTLLEKNLESRIVMKLGTLMVALFGVAGTAMTLLR